MGYYNYTIYSFYFIKKLIGGRNTLFYFIYMTMREMPYWQKVNTNLLIIFNNKNI